MNSSIAFTLYSHTDSTIRINISGKIEDGALTISGYDIGTAVDDFWGDSDYEYEYTFTKEATSKLFQLIGGSEDPVSAMVCAFSGNNCTSKLSDFCTENDIPFSFWSWT